MSVYVRPTKEPTTKKEIIFSLSPSFTNQKEPPPDSKEVKKVLYRGVLLLRTHELVAIMKKRTRTQE